MYLRIEFLRVLLKLALDLVSVNEFVGFDLHCIVRYRGRVHTTYAHFVSFVSPWIDPVLFIGGVDILIQSRWPVVAHFTLGFGLVILVYIILLQVIFDLTDVNVFIYFLSIEFISRQ